MELLKRAVHRTKEGTSAVLLQSGLGAKCSDGRTPYERPFGEPCKSPVIPFGAMVEYLPNSSRDESRLHQFGKKVLLGMLLGYALIAGENLERRYFGRRR